MPRFLLRLLHRAFLKKAITFYFTVICTVCSVLDEMGVDSQLIVVVFFPHEI
jgi:hypothetical protein